jgi:hypothetical protein
MSLNPFQGYVKVSVGNIPKSKLEKALHGLDVRLTNKDLSGDRVMVVHPQNAKMMKRAQKMGKGLTTQFTPHEAMADLEYHEKAGEGMHGGSLWSWLRDKAYPWVKKNWNVIKPVISAVADSAIPAAAAALGQPAAGPLVRGAVKQLTGVGVKGSEEAKERMAHLRSLRKKKVGGSFRMP